MVVDDRALVIDALGLAFHAEPDMELVGGADSLHALADLQHRLAVPPDVVVIDRRLPDGSGLDGCRLARTGWTRVRVVMLADAIDPDELLAAIEAGADACLAKTASLARVIDTVRSMASGAPCLTPALLGEVARRLADRAGHAARLEPPVLLEPLTPRELTVLRLLAEGHSTRLIADELALREGTVRVHVEALRRKFHVSTKLEAVSAALRHHIVEVPIA